MIPVLGSKMKHFGQKNLHELRVLAVFRGYVPQILRVVLVFRGLMLLWILLVLPSMSVSDTLEYF